MQIFAAKMRKEYKSVVFSASTNKAAAVLKSKVTPIGFDATTLNKYFGIAVKVDPNQKDYDAKNLVNDLKDKFFFPGTIVVIDEASMINEENYRILTDIAKDKNLKLIFVGDEAQLSPVNETQISKVFRNNDGKVIRLTQVERTGDNAILAEATNLRDNKPLSYISSFNNQGQGVAFIKKAVENEGNNSNVNVEAGKVIRYYINGLKDNPDYFRILAYSNSVVSKYNGIVRYLLGYNDAFPRENEPMVGYQNWGYNWRTKTYLFVNSESYKVKEVHPVKKLSYRYGDEVYEMEAIPITLEDSLGEQNQFNYMDIKNNPNNRRIAEQLANLKKQLWGRVRQAASKRDKAALLEEINTIDKFLFVNDDIKDDKGNTLQAKVIDFGYAMTVHKSQGSTFTNVLVDDTDIQNAAVTDKSGQIDRQATKALLQQLEYVAVSRATNTVSIISDDVKVEDSPLNHLNSSEEVAGNEDNVNNEIKNDIASQLVDHLRSIGVPIKNREQMIEFLDKHGYNGILQQID